MSQLSIEDTADPISLMNPMEPNPSLILLNTNDHATPIIPLFSHNCQIKHLLATFILDNGKPKELGVSRLSRPTTITHYSSPFLYHLGWVQQGGPRTRVTLQCAITFSIGPFKDKVICDVAPLDCVDLLLGLPYQATHNAVYHAKTHQYHLQLQVRTYVLTFTKKSSNPSINPQTSLNHCISLCLAHIVTINVTMLNPTPIVRQPLIRKIAAMFENPMGLPPSRTIEHTIAHLSGPPLINASAYHQAQRGVTDIKTQSVTSPTGTSFISQFSKL